MLRQFTLKQRPAIGDELDGCVAGFGCIDCVGSDIASIVGHEPNVFRVIERPAERSGGLALLLRQLGELADNSAMSLGSPAPLFDDDRGCCMKHGVIRQMNDRLRYGFRGQAHRLRQEAFCLGQTLFCLGSHAATPSS